ncbi:hypothetical protein MRX96_005267 [Rhipicephalus microplus]
MHSAVSDAAPEISGIPSPKINKTLGLAGSVLKKNVRTKRITGCSKSAEATPLGPTAFGSESRPIRRLTITGKPAALIEEIVGRGNTERGSAYAFGAALRGLPPLSQRGRPPKAACKLYVFIGASPPAVRGDADWLRGGEADPVRMLQVVMPLDPDGTMKRVKYYVALSLRSYHINEDLASRRSQFGIRTAVHHAFSSEARGICTC